MDRDGSFYFIPNGYIPVLASNSLFKNYKNTVKEVNGIKIPIFIIADLDKNHVKKSPNAFILFRCEILSQIKKENPSSSSRELSKIIGNIWKKMADEDRLQYKLKANEIKYKLFPKH